jgi:1-acyl-sn-glycerol-3-phosphate acyltransferase
MSGGRLGLFLRSAVFNVAFFGFMTLTLLASIPLLPISQKVAQWIARFMSRTTLMLLRTTVGLRWELRGRVDLLRGPALIVCKHQSAWDTIVFFMLCDQPTYVMKRELMLIPVFGWLASRQGHISIDRKAGAGALRALRRATQAAVAAGRQIVIFPQGTRVPPGEHRPYQPGVVSLYNALNRPIVPVALNSGLFWGRRKFIKRPGTVVIEVLPEIPAGLSRDEVMREIETRIETATARLEAEGRAGL